MGKHNLKAAKWYTRAADRGHLLAKAALAEMYLSGRGVQKDVQHALDLAKDLSTQKDCYRLQLAIGELYEKGVDVKKDMRKAVEWYYSSAVHGSGFARERIQQMYQAGDPVEWDEAKAGQFARNPY